MESRRAWVGARTRGPRKSGGSRSRSAGGGQEEGAAGGLGAESWS